MSQIEILIDRDTLQKRVEEIAEDIKKDLNGEPVLLIAILKGSFLFVADLSRHLGEDVEVDFMQVSSWRGGTSSSGNVMIKKDLDINIDDRNVVIVEDIVDSGLTISHLLDLLKTRRPRSLKIASLLSKPDARVIEVPIHYLGFAIPNEFVVGYGLDFAEKYRNLPYIAVLRFD